MDNVSIGLQIKSGRVKKGETQVVAGARLGVSQQMLSGWERGRRAVPKAYRKAIAKVYGVVFEEERQDITTDMNDRRLSVPDRRNDKSIQCIPIVERKFIEELKNFLDAVTVVLCNTTRGRKGRVARRYRVL